METAVFQNETGYASRVIRSGGLVAVPTETVYGLAANGLDAQAVEKIYEVKGRPAVKPLSLMVPSADEIQTYTLDAPGQAYSLASRFWPGPLTIVLKAQDFIPPIVLAGGKTVGLRCPDCELTLKLLKESAVPFAAPSANPSGQPSPKNAETVLSYFSGEIEAVIDGGECTLGLESTIIDMSTCPYRILRQGALPYEAIADQLVSHMKIFGITGCTGAGKTSALHVFKEKGALVLDCDAIYHTLLAESDEMLAELRAQFPSAFAAGHFDRKKLGEIVFNSPEALRALNDITHKYVAEAVKSRLRDFAMSGGQLAAIDAVELIASGIDRLCDCTLAITADEALRAERIMQRENISREYALQRIRAQKGEEYYRSNCTYTVENNSDIGDFTDKLLNIINEVTKNG